ncbi:MAG: hypothetical protein U9O94_04030 [Nanoarchaeota archaeon]|nr:hypothetical protein [Nanoarchaeota archaeon]
MAINHATVRSDTWDTVNAALRTLTGKAVLAEFPEDHSKVKKSDYPIITQTPAEVSQDEKFFGKTNNPKEINVFVGLYSNNPDEIDTLSDSIGNYFEVTGVSGVHLNAVNDSSVDVMQINNQNVSFRIINISFKMM